MFNKELKVARVIKGFLIIASAGILVSGCSHYDELKKDPKESASGSHESHNAGRNCGSCHNKNGTEAANEYWWTVSGTVVTASGGAQQNAVIELWEKPNKQGQLYKRIVTDKLGNFYTNQIINYYGQCYPTITVGSSYIGMTQTYTGGSCNSCHGISTSKLEID